MRSLKKLLCVILAGTVLAVSAFGSLTAQAQSDPVIRIQDVHTVPGATVDVKVAISGNTGLASLAFELSFDDALTLVGADNGMAFAGLTMIPPAKLKKGQPIKNSCRFAWIGNENVTGDGVILNLRFSVDASLTENKDCFVALKISADDALDEKRTSLSLGTQSGKIVVQCGTVFGDADGNGLVDTTDLVRIKKCLAGLIDLADCSAGADANDDKTVDTADLTCLKKYLAGLLSQLGQQAA